MKALILAAVVGVAVALPRPDHPPPGAYKGGPPPQGPVVYKAAPAPYGKPGYKEEHLPPQPYEFKYGVADQYSGTQFQAAEAQDVDGTVLGSYTVDLPDGRRQIVTYKADKYAGFVADVKYEGEPIYPPEPAEGYGANKYVALQGNPRPYKAAAPPPPKYNAA